MPYHYAVTTKKVRGKPLVSDYEDYIDFLLQGSDFCISDINYEDKHGLHIHFRLESLDRLSEREPRLYPARYGWNVKCVPEWCDTGWKKYIHKDSKDRVKEKHMADELYAFRPYAHSLQSTMSYGETEFPFM